MSRSSRSPAIADTRPFRHVLLISAAFPPTGGPGVQRVTKFAKYLPALGWRPIVWTASQLAGLPLDPTLLTDLPSDLAIHSIPARGLTRSLRRSLRGMVCGRGIGASFARTIDWRLEALEANRSRPDDCASWARASVRPVSKIIEREAVDAILSTSPAPSNHMLALAVKRSTGLPWLADFRDLWTDDYRYLVESPSRRLAERNLEQEILESADVVIGVTERQTEILAGHLPGKSDKFVTITNGFDPADFERTDGIEVPGEPRDKPFTLAHVGRFDCWRSGDALVEGLKRFVDELRADRDCFELRIVGHCGRSAATRLQKTGVRCVFTGYVSHSQAIGEMTRADALLLSVPDGPNAESVIPAKLFEYLASRRPILVVGPENGECERIVRSCGCGLTVTFSEESIAAALAETFAAWRSGQPISGCPVSKLAPFSRIELTGKLADLLNGLSSGSAGVTSPVVEACQA